MKNLALLSLLALTACFAPVEQPANAPDLRALSATEVQVVQANNAFAFDLFPQIQAEKINNNIFFSPLSVTYALSMALNGASDSVRTSILNLLHTGNSSVEEVNAACKNLTTLLTSMDRKVELGIANSAWVNQQYHLQDAFAATVRDNYDAKAQSLNFGDPATASVINAWVADKTKNRIKELLSSTSNSDALFLINALYFKGTWTYQFDKSKTVNKPFQGSPDLPTMWSPGVKLNYKITDSLMLVDLPYGNQQFSMTILMPNGAASLSELGTSLNAENFAALLSKTDTLKPELEMPRFSVTYRRDLKNDLANLGMPMVGFPRLLKEPVELEVSKIVHQAFVEVNEEGTEAAAATAIGFETTAMPRPFKIEINRPFYYFIRERHTNTILFMGRMIGG